MSARHQGASINLEIVAFCSSPSRCSMWPSLPIIIRCIYSNLSQSEGRSSMFRWTRPLLTFIHHRLFHLAFGLGMYHQMVRLPLVQAATGTGGSMTRSTWNWFLARKREENGIPQAVAAVLPSTVQIRVEISKHYGGEWVT